MAINSRFKRANALVKDNSFCSNFKYDLDEAMNCWTSNFRSFTLIDLNCNLETTGKWALDIELSDIETKFGKRLSTYPKLYTT